MNLDIIIPVYNSKDTIFRLLSSIAIQKYTQGINVIIVNDCSDYDYQEYINYFSRYFDIKEIKTTKNVGPGSARNIGIDNSKNKYIMFIDSDDYLYYPFALSDLYFLISDKENDLVISNFIYERDKKKIIKKDDYTWLHGKIYKRSFLEKYNIRFNSSRANEDNGFNHLLLLCNPKIGYLDKTTYVYSENNKSITRKNNRDYKLTGLEGLVYNMNWAIKEAEKRKKSKRKISNLAINTLIAMYFYYLELFDNINANNIIKWSKETLNIYNKYKKVSNKEINQIILNRELEYKNEKIKYKKVITFNEFIEMVGDYND